MQCVQTTLCWQYWRYISQIEIYQRATVNARETLY